MMKEKVLKVLLEKARQEILKEFNPDSCIVSTAVCIDVLKHFGILAEPLPVRVMVFNKIAVDCINKWGMPVKDHTIYEWSRKYGAWSVGVGFSKRLDTGYVGHLVALVENTEILDISLDQASRPQHKIVLSPLKFEISSDFMSGARMPFTSKRDGCIFCYEKITNYGYTQSPDWLKRSRRKHIVDKLIKIIEG